MSELIQTAGADKKVFGSDGAGSVYVALIVEDLPDAREWLLALIAKGFTTPKVGELLSITKNTAAGYVKSIYAKRVLPRFYGHFRFFNSFVEGR